MPKCFFHLEPPAWTPLHQQSVHFSRLDLISQSSWCCGPPLPLSSQLSSASFFPSPFSPLIHLLSFSITSSFFSFLFPLQPLCPGTILIAGCLVGHFKRALNRLFFFHISVSVSFQRFTNEDHLAVHKHKHEMTLKFGPARTDSVIIAGICCPRSHVP